MTKISYITPSYNGFQAGLTYAAASLPIIGDSSFARPFVAIDSTVLTAAYNGEHENIGFGVSAGYSFNTSFDETSDNNIQAWNIGARITMNNFTLAGSYKDMEIENMLDGKVWDIGLSYENGPYAASIAYLSGKVPEARDSSLLISGKYNLAAGVDTFATFGYGDYDTVENHGWTIIGGMMLSF